MSRHVMRNALLPLSTIIESFSLIGLLEGHFPGNAPGIPGAGASCCRIDVCRDYE